MASETVKQDVEARRQLAFDANYEIMKLAEAVPKICGADEDIAIGGIMKRIQQLTEIVYYAQRLHGETDEKSGAPNLTKLQRLYEGALTA